MDFLSIAQKFGISEIFSANELKAGHINKTYLINGKYVLQSLNSDIFRKPEIIMNNIRKIEKAFAESSHKYIKIPHYLEFKDKNYVEHGGRIWRMCDYIESGKPPEQPFYCIGFVVGDFLRVVNSADIEFESAMNLHNFQLDLPLRNIHGDTKSDNIILGGIPAIIDFDTAMRGYICADYGDMVRSATTEKFSLEIIKDLTGGFADALRGFITHDEIDSLYSGIILVTCELHERYCKPENFPNKTAEQCRERAENLANQCNEFEKRADDIKNLIESCFA